MNLDTILMLISEAEEQIEKIKSNVNKLKNIKNREGGADLEIMRLTNHELKIKYAKDWLTQMYIIRKEKQDGLTDPEDECGQF